MEIKIYWQMIRKGWWIVLLTALVAVNVALVVNFFSPTLYRATSKYLVNPNPKLLPVTDMVYSLDALGNRSVVMTYSELLKNEQVLIETIKQLNLDSKDLTKSYLITTTVLTETSIIELTVEGPNPNQSALLANMLGKNGISYIQKFYDVYQITQIEPASIPKFPFSPQPIRDAGLALVLGLILGAALAILSEQIRLPLQLLQEQKMIDTYSGVYKRKHFERIVEDEMLRNMNKDQVFSLGLIRLDGLVETLDGLPMVVSQKLFKKTTNCLRDNLKGTDIIGQWDRTTYAVLMPATPIPAANTLMYKICRLLSVPVELYQDGETLNLNPYAGVARSQENEAPKEFIARTQKDLDEGRFMLTPTNPILN